MQEEDDVVVGKARVALRHLLTHENLDARIERVDLKVVLDDGRLLRGRRSRAQDQPQQRGQ